MLHHYYHLAQRCLHNTLVLCVRSSFHGHRSGTIHTRRSSLCGGGLGASHLFVHRFLSAATTVEPERGVQSRPSDPNDTVETTNDSVRCHRYKFRRVYDTEDLVVFRHIASPSDGRSVDHVELVDQSLLVLRENRVRSTQSNTKVPRFTHHSGHQRFFPC